MQLMFRGGSSLYLAGALAFSSNEELAFVDSFRLRLCNIKTNKEKLSREIANGGGSYAVTVNKAGSLLGFNDGQDIKIINLTTEKTKELKGGLESVRVVTFSPDGKALSAWFGDMGVWGDELGMSKQDSYSMMAATLGAKFAFVPAANVMAINLHLDEDKTPFDIDLMEVPKMDALHSLKGHTKTINSIAASPTDPILASSSEDGTVKIWDVNNRTLINTLPEQASRVMFSPDGKLLATISRAILNSGTSKRGNIECFLLAKAVFEWFFSARAAECWPPPNI